MSPWSRWRDRAPVYVTHPRYHLLQTEREHDVDSCSGRTHFAGLLKGGTNEETGHSMRRQSPSVRFGLLLLILVLIAGAASIGGGRSVSGLQASPEASPTATGGVDASVYL